MKLELRSVIGAGDMRTERITFRALEDLDVGDYTLLQTAYVDDTLSIHVYETFWFPYQKVTKGDLVILYTRSGTARSKELNNGNTAYFHYWDRSDPIWSDNDRSAVLLHSPSWETRSAAELRSAAESRKA